MSDDFFGILAVVIFLLYTGMLAYSWRHLAQLKEADELLHIKLFVSTLLNFSLLVASSILKDRGEFVILPLIVLNIIGIRYFVKTFKPQVILSRRIRFLRVFAGFIIAYSLLPFFAGLYFILFGLYGFIG